MAQVSYGTITITDTTDIDSIKNWYLATSASSGVTKSTSGWTDTIQQITKDKQYLWNYEQVLATGGTEINSTQPIIIGHFGTNGVDGNSITSIDEYYQITNSTTNPGASGWQKNTLVVPTKDKKYLWNYQVINYSKTSAEGSYTDARIIGIYGDKGEDGISPTVTSTSTGVKIVDADGNTTYINNGSNGTSYYTHIRYATDSSGSGMSSSPTGKTYIGVYSGTSSTAPTTVNSYTWSKYVGDPGTPATQYYAFVKYATDINGSNMQDSPDSTHVYVGTYTGTSASPAASAYKWSKYVGADGQPATQYYAFIKYATSSAGANMTDTPTANTKYVGTYSGTKASPVASDYKWSEYVGANGISVTQVRELYYLTTGNAPSKPTTSSTIYNDDRVGAWTSVLPGYVANGKYYLSLETTLSNNTKTFSDVILDEATTTSSYNAYQALSISTHANEDAQGALSIATGINQHFFSIPNDYSASVPAGSYITEINVDTFKQSPSGGNLLTRSDGVWLRNGADILASLQGTGLTFLIPTGTYKGRKSLEILGGTTPALKLYDAQNNNAVATLDSNGLVLSRGGIRVNTVGSNNGVYISSENLGSKVTSLDADKTNWRAVIGSKFGVDSEGNLYANEAHISGAINATSLTIGESGYNAIDAINISGYSIEIEIDSTNASDSNHVLLYPHLYHNGEEVERVFTAATSYDANETYYTFNETINVYTIVENSTASSINSYYTSNLDYINFIWYLNNSSIGIIGDADDGHIEVTYDDYCRVVYTFEDGAVEGATDVQTVLVDPSKYITRISDSGITVHPEVLSAASHYTQIDGNGLYIKELLGSNIDTSSDTTLASFTSSGITIGDSSNKNILIDSNGLTVNNNDTVLASFGEEIQLGDSNTAYIRQWVEPVENFSDRYIGQFEFSIANNSYGSIMFADYTFPAFAVSGPLVGDKYCDLEWKNNGEELYIRSQKQDATKNLSKGIAINNQQIILFSDYSSSGTSINSSNSSGYFGLDLNSQTNGTSCVVASTNNLNIDVSGNVVASGESYSKPSSISFGSHVSAGVLTSASGALYFSIPTGRVFPSGTTLTRLVGNMVVRAGNHNAGGMYVIKSASGGTSPTSFDTNNSTLMTFYDGANTKRTPASSNFTKSIQGGTTIYIQWNTGTNYYFSGNSTNNGYVNNQPVTVWLSDLVAYFSYD